MDEVEVQSNEFKQQSL